MNASELKKAIEEYSQALSFLRDGELGDDVVSKNKAQKINENLDDLEATIRRQRLPMGFTTKESEDEKFQSQYKDAFLKYIRKGIESDLINLANSNNSMENLLKCDSNGFAITSSMNSIIANSMYKNSPIRQLARIVNISNDSLDVAAYTTDIAASWGDERTVAPETDAFTRKTIKVHELTAQPKMTQKMIDDDQIDHESWLAELLSDILLAKEDNAFFNGDGENKPVGILSYEDGTSSSQIERVSGGSAITFENLLQLQAALDGRYEKEGETAFITSKANLAAIRSIKDESGRYIWTPGALNGNYDMIFGTPILASNEMDTSEGDAVIYGNLRKGYQIVDRSDIKIQRDPYSSKPFIVYFATKRVGGDVIDTKAIKILSLS
ncbi:MAG: phage major capsid protein [Rickettsiales bacterium]|nr:phage major capsid protein [Rickettsiales bacterium]